MNPFVNVFDIQHELIVVCPHCSCFAIIEKINCQIFRHAYYKVNNEQIPPHTSQADCEALIANQSIYGCGKPFRIIFDDTKEGDEKFVAVICEYI